MTESDKSALNCQIGGKHYSTLPIQPIEYIVKNNLNWFQGNMVKYATRYPYKNKAEDLRKIIHYATLALEIEYGEKP